MRHVPGCVACIVGTRQCCSCKCSQGSFRTTPPRNLNKLTWHSQLHATGQASSLAERVAATHLSLNVVCSASADYTLFVVGAQLLLHSRVTCRSKVILNPPPPVIEAPADAAAKPAKGGKDAAKGGKDSSKGAKGKGAKGKAAAAAAGTAEEGTVEMVTSAFVTDIQQAVQVRASNLLLVAQLAALCM